MSIVSGGASFGGQAAPVTPVHGTGSWASTPAGLAPSVKAAVADTCVHRTESPLANLPARGWG
jgi:hypothetical protein